MNNKLIRNIVRTILFTTLIVGGMVIMYHNQIIMRTGAEETIWNSVWFIIGLIMVASSASRAVTLYEKRETGHNITQ